MKKQVSLKKVELQPFSSWKALAAAIGQLPMNLRSAIDPNRGKKAILLRSPDRVIGLADALRQSGRARTFGLSEAMAIAYVRDIRFVLLRFFCLVGFGAWWYLLPEPLLVQPTACSSLSLRP